MHPVKHCFIRTAAVLVRVDASESTFPSLVHRHYLRRFASAPAQSKCDLPRCRAHASIMYVTQRGAVQRVCCSGAGRTRTYEWYAWFTARCSRRCATAPKRWSLLLIKDIIRSIKEPVQQAMVWQFALSRISPASDQPWRRWWGGI